MSVAVLIPARNEGPRIYATLQGVRAVLPEAMLLVVDGGSSDDTRREARRAGAEVIPQQGQGYASALRSGYRFLLDQGIEQVVQLDADGQHPPQHARRLLVELNRVNLVFGSRHGTECGGELTRRVGNALLAQAVQQITGLGLQDVTSGYWALDRRSLELLVDSMPPDVADANLRVVAWKGGLALTELPVCMAPRQGGQSMHDGWRGVRNFSRSLRALYRASR